MSSNEENFADSRSNAVPKHDILDFILPVDADRQFSRTRIYVHWIAYHAAVWQHLSDIKQPVTYSQCQTNIGRITGIGNRADHGDS